MIRSQGIVVIVTAALLMCSRSAEASQFYRLPYGGSENVSADGTAVTAFFSGEQSGIWYPRTGTTTVVTSSAPGFTHVSDMTSISADGTIATGLAWFAATAQYKAFRWTQATGMEFLPVPSGYFGSTAFVSADGSASYGVIEKLEDSSRHLVRWADGLSPTFLNPVTLPAEYRSISFFSASADGSAFAANLFPSSGDVNILPGRWTGATGVTSFGTLPEWPNGFSQDISGDGSTIVGYIQSQSDLQAFRWTNDTGLVGLGFLPGKTTSSATAVSPDGSLVLGVARNSAYSSSREMFVWTASTGMKSLTDILVQEVGDELRRSMAPLDLSADGRTIIGRALDFDAGGNFVTEWPWAVVLDRPLQDLLTAVPEPATIVPLILGMLGIRWRRNQIWGSVRA